MAMILRLWLTVCVICSLVIGAYAQDEGGDDAGGDAGGDSYSDAADSADMSVEEAGEESVATVESSTHTSTVHTTVHTHPYEPSVVTAAVAGSVAGAAVAATATTAAERTPRAATMPVAGGGAKKVAKEVAPERASSAAAEDEEAPKRSIPQLAPGTWQPLFELGESIYPSVVISTATLKEGLWDDAQHVGDPWGDIGVFVRGTNDNCPVTVTIAGGSLIKASTYTGVLADKNTVYCVYPELQYDYEKLLTIKQTVPETIRFNVSIGKARQPEKTMRVQVRPVNECVFAFIDAAGNAFDVSFFFAAYVNENSPIVNQILKEAIELKKVDSFSGYSGDRDSVLAEIEAIWTALQRRGIHYSTMPASADDDNPYLSSQYVRLLSESINYSQANCVDGSVLMASLLRRIGLDVNLVKFPTHMLVSVALDEKGDEAAFIETTVLGEDSLDDAMEEGKKQYMENKNKFDSEKDEDAEYGVINIQSARVMGIMPIKDAAAS